MTDPQSVALQPEVVQAFQSIAQWAAGALLGMAGIFGLIVKWMMSQLEKREGTSAEVVKEFREAVKVWREFELEERSAHGRMIEIQRETSEALRGIAMELRGQERERERDRERTSGHAA